MRVEEIPFLDKMNTMNLQVHTIYINIFTYLFYIYFTFFNYM